MSQTSYGQTPAVGFPGQLADLAYSRYVRSYLNGESSALGFGLLVARGSAEGKFKLPTAAADKFLGVLVHSHAYMPVGVTGTVEPIAASTGKANVLCNGAIYVQPEETVAADTDPVYVRVAGTGTKGSLRKSADGGNAVLVRGARWLTGGTSTSPAVVFFDFSAEDASQGLEADLASVDAAKGASKIGLQDAGARFAGATAEAAFGETLVKGDLLVVESTPGSEASNAIEVACAVKDVLGNAVAAAREVAIRTLAPTDDQGDIAAAGTPVGTLGKASNPAAGANEAWMTATAGGLFSFKVTDTAAESVLVEIVADGCRPRLLKLTFA